MGLILAGGIVFWVGMMIVLFREFDIPRYWIPAVVGIQLMVAGGVIHKISLHTGSILINSDTRRKDA